MNRKGFGHLPNFRSILSFCGFRARLSGEELMNRQKERTRLVLASFLEVFPSGFSTTQYLLAYRRLALLHRITFPKLKIRNLTDIAHHQRLGCAVIPDAVPTPFDNQCSSASSHDLLEREIVWVGGKSTAYLLAFGMVAIPLAVIGGQPVALLGMGFAGITFLKTAT
jgi:hypothetical protein